MKMQFLFQPVLNILRGSTGKILTLHLIYTLLGVFVFTSLLGFIGRYLLDFSGEPVLSDMDIAYFFLSPLGMTAGLLFSALIITIIIFEQASLMAVSEGRLYNKPVTIAAALYFTAIRAKKIYFFALHLILRIFVIVVPFLAIAGLIAWSLITDYDINYYLNEKPPVFIVTLIIAGLLILLMLYILIRKLLGWTMALPLILFTDTSAAQSFAESEKKLQGQRRNIVTAFLGWAVFIVVVSALMVSILYFIGTNLVPLFFASFRWLVVVMGALLALLTISNFFITTLASGYFSALLVVLYQRYNGDSSFAELSSLVDKRHWSQVIPRWVIVFLVVGTMAFFFGTWLINGLQINDNVMVIAHRGATSKAPENTLAAIRQAVKDRADWVEIDVQETRDGEVVVVHDSDFMKLSGVSTKVWDGTLTQLRTIDIGSWFGEEFSDQRIITLREALEAVRGRSKLLIELKYYGHDEQLEQRVIDIVEAADMVNEVAVMSLKYAAVVKFHRLRPDWTVGLLSSKVIGNLNKLDVDFLAVNLAMISPGLIRRIHSAGKDVYVWTANDAVTMSEMMSLGVDGIITDETEEARHVLLQRSEFNSVERLLIQASAKLGKPVLKRIYRDQSP